MHRFHVVMKNKASRCGLHSAQLEFGQVFFVHLFDEYALDNTQSHNRHGYRNEYFSVEENGFLNGDRLFCILSINSKFNRNG